MQLEIPIATAVAAARVARDAGAVVIVNASPAGAEPHDLLALSELADVVVVNEAEAREWHWPVPHLVITRGPRGASYLGEDERFDVPAPAVEAGRHHRRGRCVRRSAGRRTGWRATRHALRRACAAGALSTLVPGAGDCAPYAEAIDDAVSNRKAGEGNYDDDDHAHARPTATGWARRFLRFTREGPFGVCTLDRPEARNAMTPAMYFGIKYAVRHVDADPDLAGLLITGTGDVFAPGGDIGGGDGHNWLTFGSALGMDVTPFETLRQSVKPVVSAVNGLCQGGGLQIALCSDMAVVSDRATFRVPELFRGIADTYYSQMLARLIGPVRTRDLMFTGRTLTAAEAEDWGMVARVVPHDQLIDAARDVLGQCCRTAPAGRRMVKSSLDNYMGLFDRIGMQASYASPKRSRDSWRSRSAGPRLGASRAADRRPTLAISIVQDADLF